MSDHTSTLSLQALPRTGGSALERIVALLHSRLSTALAVLGHPPMYTAHAQGRAVLQQDVIDEIRHTRPLSVVMAEKVEALREWASSRTVPCD